MLPLTLASLLWLSPAHPGAEPRAQKPEGITQSTGKKKKVIRLDAITVEGRIQKPQAFYILQRSNLNFDELNKSESFIPKVEKSVEKDPF